MGWSNEVLMEWGSLSLHKIIPIAMTWVRQGRREIRDRGSETEGRRTASKGDSSTSVWRTDLNHKVEIFYKSISSKYTKCAQFEEQRKTQTDWFPFSAINLDKELVPLQNKICGSWNSSNILHNGGKIWMVIQCSLISSGFSQKHCCGITTVTKSYLCKSWAQGSTGCSEYQC